MPSENNSQSSSDAFWTDPPWANGVGHYQMGLAPINNNRWCHRAASASEQRAKIKLLQTQTSTVLQSLPESAHAQHLLAVELAQQHTLIEPDDFDHPLLEELPHNLVSSALSVPEDLCLLQDDGHDYHLIAACVCAPSYWFLPDKVGQSLSDLHQDVPGLNKALGARMNEFFRKLPEARTFTRRNWLIHSSNELFQPRPEQRHKLTTIDQAEGLQVRSESQTFRRLAHNVIVFTIAIQCHPLTEIRAYPMAATALRQALLSRSTDERNAASQPMYEQAVLALLNETIAQ